MDDKVLVKNGYIGNRGVHNWKNLFKKPTLSDWIILFMLVMVLFIAFAYQRDIQACRDFYEDNSCELCSNQLLLEGEISNAKGLPIIIKEDERGNG